MNLTKPNKSIGPQVRQKQDNKTNIRLIGMIILGFLISLEIGTQYVAYKFHYHDSLGFSFAHIYLPWQLLLWNMKYHIYHPDYFNAAFGIMAMSSCLF
jgi:type IV secretion system protein VirD4